MKKKKPLNATLFLNKPSPARFEAVLKVSGEEVTVPNEPTPVTAGKSEKAAATTSQNE